MSDFVQSPLNYTGGKYKLLNQIIPLFPSNINTFIDLFCGGGNVGININANKIILNDLNQDIINIIKLMKKAGPSFSNQIDKIITKYNLSNTFKHEYSFYKCNSSDGLAKYNKDNYLKLRADFNKLLTKDDNYYYHLYTLMIYSFNNQIRFNSKEEFNLPVGKRDFNQNLRNKASKFINLLTTKNLEFSSIDFSHYDIESLSKDDFIYIDPPYLITIASYNENNGWSDIDEYKLLNFIDSLIKNDIRFALSNVLESKGKENKILKSWIETNDDKITVHHLDYSYSNSNYQTKNKDSFCDEILVTNY